VTACCGGDGQDDLQFVSLLRTNYFEEFYIKVSPAASPPHAAFCPPDPPPLPPHPP
jgi:hypothetical protein